MRVNPRHLPRDAINPRNLPAERACSETHARQATGSVGLPRLETLK